MHSVLIVNPRASKVTEPLVEQVARTLDVADVLRTERGGHATELVAGLGGAERIYVFSGDGGFNEALNGSDGSVAARLRPRRRHERASTCARDPARPRRGGAQARGGEHAADLARPREWTPLRLRRRAWGSMPSSCGEWTTADATRAAAGPGDLVFAWTAVKTLAESRLRFEPVLEIEGHGRAAFALVANADPYSYVGRLPLRLPRGAQIDGGLDLLAPRSFRARSLPGAVSYILTGRTRLPLVHLHDADRIEIRCDVPMPLQLDGEDLGDVIERRVRGGAGRRLRPRLNPVSERLGLR